MSRLLLRALAVASVAGLLGAASFETAHAAAPNDEGGPRSVALKDPDGHLVDPFLASEDADAMVLLFASVDCPVSNRYAPEVKRIHERFAPRHVAFWLVYPNPGDTPEAVREHLRAFDYPVHALLDPGHDLVKLAQASITPEAAVFAKDRRLAYHGRIDDRFVSLGVERPAATQHDLADAIGAVLEGKSPAEASAPAVGCFIVDFVQ